MGLEEIIDSPALNSLIDGIIVFAIAMITELLAVGGIPTGAELYHASLVAILAGVVFYAKNKGIEYNKNR